MRALILIACLAASFMASADDYVNPYIRNDGTYVQGHMRSNPDGQSWNNYSHQGNVNPYTGQRGYQNDTYSNGINSNSINNSYGYGAYGRQGGNSNSIYGR